MDSLIAMDATLEIRGRSLPRVGFGTWQLTGRDCADAVADALALGYRHIDTARAYENESEVGAGISASGIPREQIWLTSKVWMDDAPPERLRRSAEASLRDLGVERLDLLLLHWPNEHVPLEQTLAALVELREQGLIGELGVSNFPPGLLRQALALAPVFCNQVEYHPLLSQEELLEIAREQELVIAAYAPLAHGDLLAEPVLGEIGAAHGKTAAQVALRWLIEEPHVCALPKAASHQRRAENLDIFDFELSDAEREQIRALPKDRRRFDPAWAPDWTR